MDKDKVYSLIFQEMLSNCISNIVVRRVKEGQLIQGVSKSTVEVLDADGNKHYLVHVGDVYHLEGGKVELNGNTRNAIAKEFISKYSYKDVLNAYNKHLDAIKLKVVEAEKTKPLLVALISKIKELSDLMVEPVLLADNTQYKYYVQYKLGLSNSIEIYLTDKANTYNCGYNGDWTVLNSNQLHTMLRGMIDRCKAELKKNEEDNKRRLSEQEKDRLIDDFVSKVWYSKVEVIVKLKSGYQCISSGRRYSVGTGKEGKFFNIANRDKLREYIEKRGINEYYILRDGECTSRLTDDVLKKLPYYKIID